jgi:hypothetical protein
VGPTVSGRGREEWVPVRVLLDGPRALFSSGPKGFPGFFYYFSFLSSFSFSVFLISSIIFANLIQIKPNKIHKFYKIHSKV